MGKNFLIFGLLGAVGTLAYLQYKKKEMLNEPADKNFGPVTLPAIWAGDDHVSKPSIPTSIIPLPAKQIEDTMIAGLG